MRILIPAIVIISSIPALAGYDLHITRRSHWADEKGAKISFREWLVYAKSDKSIRLDPENTKYDFILSHAGETIPLWYDPDRGELCTKNPPKSFLPKLIQIAKALKAKVQGDDGEFYPPAA